MSGRRLAVKIQCDIFIRFPVGTDIAIPNSEK
jgi:hypothetical protein